MKALTLKQNVRIITNPKDWVGMEETETGYKLYFSSNLTRLNDRLSNNGKRGYLFKRDHVAKNLQKFGSFDPREMTNIKT